MPLLYKLSMSLIRKQMCTIGSFTFLLSMEFQVTGPPHSILELAGLDEKEPMCPACKSCFPSRCHDELDLLPTSDRGEWADRNLRLSDGHYDLLVHFPGQMMPHSGSPWGSHHALFEAVPRNLKIKWH